LPDLITKDLVPEKRLTGFIKPKEEVMSNLEPTKEEQRNAHKNLLNYIENLYVTKNNAYGNSFSRLYEEVGILSAATSIGHKYHRFINLAKNGEENFGYEGLRDTLVDMANYCLLAVMELDKQEKRKTQSISIANDTGKQVQDNEGC